MKKSLLLLITIFFVVSAFSQNRDENPQGSQDLHTLMGRNNTVGGYFNLNMHYTEIEERDAFMFGIKGGMIMGRLITLGLSGTVFFNDTYYNEVQNVHYSISGAYGGVFFEPIVMPKLPVHVAFPIMVGAGGLAIVNVNKDRDWGDKRNVDATDAFMIIEPGIEVELNVTRFFRFSIGTHYRYTTGVDIEGIDYCDIPSDIFQGFSGGVSFKFGRF
jgi:hypothetical protein